MRLGQLARKYGVSQQEIISQLKEMDPSYHKLGHNTKLNEQALTWLAHRLEKDDDLIISEQADDTPLDQSPVEEQTVAPITESEDEISPPPKAADESSESPQVPEVPTKEEVVIETDKLLELLESEETPEEISKITLIKAPKRELDGLKVVGKIDLPEPKVRSREKNKESKESQEGTSSRSGKKSNQLTEEEKEKRRLRAKSKKEAYEARQEKRRKAKEKQRRKELNRLRYQQKLQRSKPIATKTKDQVQEMPELNEVPISTPPPKTLLGKFWRWLNTP